MLRLNNIHPLTDFKRNASAYIEQVRKTLSPLVLTVNGKAAVVVHDAKAFQAMLDRQKAIEDELRDLKCRVLRKKLKVSKDRSDRVQFVEYSEDTLSELFDDIRQQGQGQRITLFQTISSTDSSEPSDSFPNGGLTTDFLN